MGNKEIAEKWAEEYLNSEEGKKETALLNKEALEYMLYGKPTRYLNEELLDEMNSFLKIEELTVNEVVERYKEFLTEKDIENLNKIV